MTQKMSWLPIDERLIPDIISLKYPKSKLVRIALFLEMMLAVVAVIGTLFLTLLPKTATAPQEINATTSTSSSYPK